MVSCPHVSSRNHRGPEKRSLSSGQTQRSTASSVGCLHVCDFMVSGTCQDPHAGCRGAYLQAETEPPLLPHLSR